MSLRPVARRQLAGALYPRRVCAHLLRNAMGAATMAVIAGQAAAQQTTQPKQPRPEDTEVWTPVPRVVTPGATEGAPPSDAIVLFDGKNLDQWVAAKDASSPAGWKVANGVATVNKAAGDIQTRRSFSNYQLHVEWRVPVGVTGSGQERGNSGVYLAITPKGGYELQVLDSYNNPTYVNGQAASMYKQYAPLVNAMRPPGQWQVYDVVWTAPTFNDDGTLKTPAYVTAFHNGVLVQNHVALKGFTENIGTPHYVKHGPAPILLQAHGDPSPPISFRNIWVREIPAPAPDASPTASTDQTHDDWANLARYRSADSTLAAPAAGERRVVFMGNSITDAWAPLFPVLFPGRQYIGRGISGQTTPQMLVRFRQDVIALKPAAVVILAGTNDIAGNTGPSTLAMIEDNIASMTELAQASGIRVVLSSVLPVFDYPWRPGLQPVSKIAALNDWMRSYAARVGAVYLDYYTAMVDERHGLRGDLTHDGVHPTEAGYRVMAPLADAAIAEALRQ